jgi:superfamily II DNA or RNA helicase
MQFIVGDVVTVVKNCHRSGDISRALSFKKPNMHFNPYYRQGLVDGVVRFLKPIASDEGYIFPTGLLSLAIDAAVNSGIDYKLEDRRTFLEANPSPDLPGMSMQGKFAFQYEAVEQACLQGRGIICAPTGSGKTVIGAGIIHAFGKRTLWLTDRRALARQTQEVLSHALQEKVGIFGDGEEDLQRVTVCMVQSLSAAILRGTKDHVREFAKDAEVVIGDEIHHLESSQWYRMFQVLQAPARFGLSATVRLENAGMYLRAQTGDIIYKITTDQLIEAGVIVQPRIWFASPTVPKLPKKLEWADVYNQGIVHAPERNNMIAHIAGVFASEKKPTLILVNRIAHGELLVALLEQRGMEYGWICGKVKQAAREKIIQQVENGELHGLVAVASTMGEGISIPELRAIINATGTRGGRSEEDETGRMTLQMLGRVLRTIRGTGKFGEKTYADYVDFVDSCHKSLATASVDRITTLEEAGYVGSIKYWSDYTTAI